MSGLVVHAVLTEKIGPFETGNSRLQINRMSDPHLPMLENLVADSVYTMSWRERNAAHRPDPGGEGRMRRKEES